jgi:hypothetical protein
MMEGFSRSRLARATKPGKFAASANASAADGQKPLSCEVAADLCGLTIDS